MVKQVNLLIVSALKQLKFDINGSETSCSI
jgi:hypothetical protein